VNREGKRAAGAKIILFAPRDEKNRRFVSVPSYMAKIFKHRTDVAYFDYKDFKTLQRYVNGFGQIESRKKTGLKEHEQRRLAVAIKRARHIALLPFVASN
jgi:small subunit ribosomal protein S18